MAEHYGFSGQKRAGLACPTPHYLDQSFEFTHKFTKIPTRRVRMPIFRIYFQAKEVISRAESQSIAKTSSKENTSKQPSLRFTPFRARGRIRNTSKNPLLRDTPFRALIFNNPSLRFTTFRAFRQY